MPELPDVEIHRRHLARTSLHRPVAQVRVTDADFVAGLGPRALGNRLRGRSLERTHRHGKHLLVELSGGGVLAVHFGMTGRLATGEDDPVTGDHTRVLVGFEDGHWLAVVDQRRLGHVAVADDVDQLVAREGLGPDALDLDAGALHDVLQGSRGSVKATLMDQARIAGLGNIYTDEVLFQARVDPTAAAGSLDARQCRRLHRQLQRVVALAVERDADPGRLPRTWLLPHREDGARCPRGRGTIRRFRSGGRAGYWCPACQRGS